MAGDSTLANTKNDADWSEHEKTYAGFLTLLKVTAVASAITVALIIYLLKH
jgi:Bacterial aa3 type cytochrome c oxidase subunit IV